MKKYLIVISLLFLAFPQIMAGDRTEQQMKEAAAKVLNNNVRRAASSSELKEFKSFAKLKIYGYDKGGFAIVTTDDRFDEVIGYSSSSFNDNIPCGFRWWMEAAEKVMEDGNGQRTDKQHAARNRAGRTSISPMMTTKWGQGRPFYDDCTFTNNGRTYQCATGCVATAMAQVMNYHRYPDRGNGSNSYTVTYNNSFTITYSKDFSQSSYDWNNMLDDYSSYSWNNLKDEHTIAVAKLMYDCGVSVNMKYSDIITGSSAEMEKVESALEQFFLYRNTTNIYYRATCSSEWMDIIYNELKAGRPILYSGTRSLNENGHAFVIHGYDASTEQVYVNWGWDGRFDGYYNIDMLNPDVYQFNSSQTMVIAVPETGQSYKTYDLGISASGNGSVSFKGDAIKNSTKTYTLDEGSSATLTFIPDDGYKIKSVSVNGVDVTSQINFNEYTINRLYDNTTITVVFEAIPPTYVLTIKATGNGIVTYGENSIRDKTYYSFISGGSSVTLNILPDNGYRIKKVTNNSTDVTSQIYNNQYTISSINSRTEINVVFEAIPTTNYNLTITASGNGSVTYGTTSIRDNTSTFSVEEGSGATLLFMPDEGNVTNSLVINGTDVTSRIKNNQYTISKISSNTTVSVFFKVDDYAYNSIEINGVYYNLSGKTKTAEVTNSPNRYSGYNDIIIPEAVDYQGITYQVTQIGDEAFRASNLLSISIPESITIIGNDAFANCRKLSSLVLPNSVQDIGKNAFNSSKLSSINIPDGITIIRTGTFSHCSSLRSIKIPDTVTSLESGVFYSCSALDSVSLSANLTAIGSTCFYGCESLTSIVCMAKDVPKVKSSTFENTIIENITLYVPKNSVNKYKSQEPWSRFGKIVSLSGTSQYILTYKVDGLVYKTYTIEEGESITPEPAPTKEGYTFSGWSDIPQTMPDHDVTVTGSFTINKYKLTYKVDGAVYKTVTYEYGAKITPEAAPTKEGYTFSGWSSIPATMPAKDVTVTGSFTINKYKLTYMVDGAVYKTVTYEYGARITPEAAPMKEGFTFSGWSNIPSTMPANDVTVTGTFSRGSFTLTYVVDGVTYKTVSYNYGETIIPEAAPTKEGYTFSGWSYIPSTMPAENVTVTGTFTVNKYTLTYKVDGAVYKTVTYEYGARITPEASPTKEGYMFSGWSNIPSTMPANDVTVTGTFSRGSFTLTYVVDGVTYKTVNYNYGETIIPEAVPSKEGYTFSGWSYIPSTMPAENVTVTGTFTVNKYTLTYKVDGAVYKTVTYEYGARITPEAAPTKEGYTFSGWSSIPATMPAHDVTVTGTFTKDSYKLIYKIDGEVYKTVSYDYGETITPEADPSKEGYTFSGWSEIPKTMPDHDVTVTGTFTINKYKLIYKVDGEVYKSYEIEYGATITPEAEPTKEGYKFSGWSYIPSKMPAEDVTVVGTFTQEAVIKDNVYYEIDGDNASVTHADNAKGEIKIEASVVINGKTYNVTSIADGAFQGCTGLTSVEIPNTVTSIGKNAFDGCSGLIVIKIGKGIKEIGSKAFANIATNKTRTRAEDVELKVYCEAEVLPSTAADAFENTPIDKATLYVVDEMVTVYKYVMPWNGFGKILGFEEAAGINAIMIDSGSALIFDMQGNRLDNVRKGVNIIRTKDGKTKKMMVK